MEFFLLIGVVVLCAVVVAAKVEGLRSELRSIRQAVAPDVVELTEREVVSKVAERASMIGGGA